MNFWGTMTGFSHQTMIGKTIKVRLADGTHVSLIVTA
jgi:hypothetical protein